MCSSGVPRLTISSLASLALATVGISCAVALATGCPARARIAYSELSSASSEILAEQRGRDPVARVDHRPPVGEADALDVDHRVGVGQSEQVALVLGRRAHRLADDGLGRRVPGLADHRGVAHGRLERVARTGRGGDVGARAVPADQVAGVHQAADGLADRRAADRKALGQLVLVGSFAPGSSLPEVRSPSRLWRTCSTSDGRLLGLMPRQSSQTGQTVSVDHDSACSTPSNRRR